MSRVNTTFQITRGREISHVWVYYYYFLISYPISQKGYVNWKKHLGTWVGSMCRTKKVWKLKQFTGKVQQKKNTLFLYFILKRMKISRLVMSPYWRTLIKWPHLSYSPLTPKMKSWFILWRLYLAYHKIKLFLLLFHTKPWLT